MIVNVTNLSRETRIVFDVRSRAVIVTAGKSMSPDLSEATIARMRKLPKVWQMDASRPAAAEGPAASLTLSQVSAQKAETVFRPVRERGAALSKLPPDATAPGAAAAVGAEIAPGAASGDGGGIIPRPNFEAPGGGRGRGRDRG